MIDRSFTVTFINNSLLIIICKCTKNFVTTLTVYAYIFNGEGSAVLILTSFVRFGGRVFDLDVVG